MACSFVGLRRSLFYYHQTKPKISSDQELVNSIQAIRFKFGNLGAKKLGRLLSSESKRVNHKRIARVIRENNLVISLRKKRRIRYENIERLPIPSQAKHVNGVWSIDFMCARKCNSFRFMVLNVIDIYSRQARAMIVERSFTTLDVTNELEKTFKTMGKPEGVITDNGLEFTSVNFRQWCKRNNITHYLTKKASPAENCYVESFNSSVRREVLDANDFTSITKLREKVETWREFYNTVRPHGSLGYQSPENYIMFEKSKMPAV